MKKSVFLLLVSVMTFTTTYAQQPDTILETTVSKLDKAKMVEDYEQLAEQFLQVADERQTQWLPYYYAAFCNAKIGWMKFEDPDNIEPYADKADEQIQKAKELLDSADQPKEMSEVYVILSMINRARVYINPETQGRRYGIPEKYATPKLYGGDKTKAKELLMSAKRILSIEPHNGIAPRWGMHEVDELLGNLR